MSRVHGRLSVLFICCLGLAACSDPAKPTQVALPAPRCARVPAAHDWAGTPEPQNRRVEFRPVLHSSEEELAQKRTCEDWLRQHARQCEPNTTAPDARQACSEVENALTYWYLPD